jgi:hypothetical protein
MSTNALASGEIVPFRLELNSQLCTVRGDGKKGEGQRLQGRVAAVARAGEAGWACSSALQRQVRAREGWRGAQGSEQGDAGTYMLVTVVPASLQVL